MRIRVKKSQFYKLNPIPSVHFLVRAFTQLHKNPGFFVCEKPMVGFPAA
jgi:hypothetical protein